MKNYLKTQWRSAIFFTPLCAFLGTYYQITEGTNYGLFIFTAIGAGFIIRHGIDQYFENKKNKIKEF